MQRADLSEPGAPGGDREDRHAKMLGNLAVRMGAALKPCGSRQSTFLLLGAGIP